MDEKALNELLECSVCLDQLDHTSKVLPCQHTFCKRCLEEIVSTKRELRCPECRTLVEIKVEDLPTNILLIRLLEGLKNANNPVLAAHQAGVARLQLQSRQHDGMSSRDGGALFTGGSSAPDRQTLTTQASQPSAKALFNYEAKEQGDLAFRKGDIINLRKQIDMNWFQGELNGQTGYFPASYVQVITALPSLIPQCKALYDFDMKDENEKDCLTFHKDEIVTVIRRVDDNWIEGRKGDRIGIFPISFVELNDAAKCLINTKSSTKPSVIVTTGRAPSPSQPAEMPTIPVTLPSSCNGSSAGRKVDSVSVISQNMFATSPGTLIYVAMYNYKPQKEDEVELRKGEYYTVHEKCQDGWFKGTSLKSGHSGVFPGNYVQLVRSSIPMKPVNSNVLNIRAKAPAAAPTVSLASTSMEPPPLPQSSPHKTVSSASSSGSPAKPSLQQSACSDSGRSGSSPHVPVRQTGPPLMPRMGKAAVVAASQAASASSNKSSHVTNLSSVAPVSVKHPHAVSINVNSHSSSTKSSNSSKGGNHVDVSSSGSGHVSKKSSSHAGNAVLAQSNPGYTNSASISKPHGAQASGSNVVISAPPNTVAGATGGATGRLTSSSSPNREKDREKKDRGKEKLSLVKRLTPGKSKRSKSQENETAAAAPAVTVADVGISHVRFRCIVPYPPQSDAELELKHGDVVFVHKKREDGWYKGTLQRTGKTGLFPGSFVEKYD